MQAYQGAQQLKDSNHCGPGGLGKFSEWSEPVNLGPDVNSTFDDWFPTVSRDGLSLYISSNRPGSFGGGFGDIWVSRRASCDESWGVPVHLGPPVNNGANAFLPNLSPDGHWLFFTSSRTEGSCGRTDLWVSWRRNREDDFGWESPVNLGCTINSSAQDNAPNVFEDDEAGITTLFFTSPRLGGVGSWDIYASMLRGDGSFGSPALVPELSTLYEDLRTAIRRDGLEMLLYSDRPGIGSYDLWVSIRETTRDAWSTPVNLGPIVNTDAQDRGPALSWDATTLYFNSNRPGGFGGQDIYATTRTRVVGRPNE